METCHMRNTDLEVFGIQFGDAERNSLSAPTRFVHQCESLSVLKTFLDDQRCDDGLKKPVILIGHGFNHDEEHFKSEWNWDIRYGALKSVVYTITSLTGLGIRAGIFPKPPKAEPGEPSNSLRFHDLLIEFNIKTGDLWLHNGANDAVYDFLVFSLIVLNPMLYPDADTPFTADSSINGQTLNEILDVVAVAKKKVDPPTWGYAKYCFYCEADDDHDSEEKKEICKASLECTLCKAAPGSENAKFRAKKNRTGHTADRCVHQYRHVIPPLPEWVTEKLNDEECRAFSRAVAARDNEVVAALILEKFLPAGPLGIREVEAHDIAEKKEMLRLWNLETPGDGDVETLKE